MIRAYAQAFAAYLWVEGQAAAIVRVPVRRSVVRIRIGEPVISTVVPVATEAEGTHGVRVDKVRTADIIPNKVKE